MSKSVALITDGRFSGGTRGPCIGLNFPEASEGRPITLIHDGDEIRIDIPGRTLELQVAENELNQRRTHFQAPVPKYQRGGLSRYGQVTRPASQGASIA